jgi:hypothetical protein
MEELSLMVEATKGITFENVLVAEMAKQRNHCLVEKVLINWTVIKDVIRRNMLQT